MINCFICQKTMVNGELEYYCDHPDFSVATCYPLVRFPKSINWIIYYKNYSIESDDLSNTTLISDISFSDDKFIILNFNISEFTSLSDEDVLNKLNLILTLI